MTTHLAPRRRASRFAVAALAGLATLGVSATAVGAQDTKGTTPTSLKVAKANMVAAPATTDIVTFWTGVVEDANGRTINGGKAVTAAGSCTAFTVASDGYMATAGHCVDPDSAVNKVLAEAVRIELATGKWTKGEGENKRPATSDDLIAYAAKNWSVSPQRDVRVHVPQVAGEVSGANDAGYISARVLEFRGWDDGDLSLLKIEATNLPVLELADTSTVREGMEVVSIGYAQATGELTDRGAPTYKDGKISSMRTMEGGKLPVYEVSTGMTHGMSGGPTVDADGRVIGVNSFGSTKAQSFNYVRPASQLQEMLRKNGVDTALSDADTAYRTALDAMNDNDAVTADAQFKTVLATWPTHVQALKLGKDAASVAATQPKGSTEGVDLGGATSKHVTTPATDDGIPVALLAGIPVVLLVGAVVLLLVALRSSRSNGPVSPASPGSAFPGSVPPPFGGPVPAPQPMAYTPQAPVHASAYTPQAPVHASAYTPQAPVAQPMAQPVAQGGWKWSDTITTAPMVVINPNHAHRSDAIG